MLSRLSLAGVAAALIMCLLPIKAGGCGNRQACITMSPSKYAKAGRCPSVTEMEEFFAQNCQTSKVASVDGEGTYDGQLCCYAVTNFNNDQGDFVDCVGGFGGSFGGGGFGGAGGGCATCPTLLDVPGTSPNSLCFEDPSFFDLTECGCSFCDECQLNLCENTAITSECQSCLQDSCTAEAEACRNSF